MPPVSIEAEIEEETIAIGDTCDCGVYWDPDVIEEHRMANGFCECPKCGKVLRIKSARKIKVEYSRRKLEQKKEEMKSEEEKKREEEEKRRREMAIFSKVLNDLPEWADGMVATKYWDPVDEFGSYTRFWPVKQNENGQYYYSEEWDPVTTIRGRVSNVLILRDGTVKPYKAVEEGKIVRLSVT